MKRRILRPALTVTLVLLFLLAGLILLPQKAEALVIDSPTLDHPFRYDSASDLYYIIEESDGSKSVTVIKTGKIDVKSVVIPEKIEDIPVTAIRSKAFSNLKVAGEITIPSSIKTIQSDAFTPKQLMTKVHISDLAAWLKIDFGNANANPLRQGGKLYLNGEPVTELAIPEGVSGIKDYAFFGCTSLTKITLSDNVQSIGARAFENCFELKTVVIGNKLDNVQIYAFSGCKKLTDVYAPSIERWCSIAFLNGEANPLYYAENLYINGVLLTDLTYSKGIWPREHSIRSYAFINYDKLKTVTLIGKEHTSIGTSAFSGCINLSSVTLPNEIKIISEDAFAYCRSLKNIRIPESVLFIKSRAFFGCTGLTEISIPKNVDTIGSSAFSHCKGLTDVSITAGSKTVHNDAFFGCTNLKNMHTQDLGLWCKMSFSNQTANPLRFAESFYVNGTLVTEINVPTDVRNIGEYAFAGYEKLTHVTLPEGIKTLRKGVFFKCTGLTEITLPKSIETIRPEAFSGCTGLTEIVIPDGVAELPSSVFSDCESLQSVKLPSKLKTIEKAAFQNCVSLKSLSIPESVTEISAESFKGCTALEFVGFHGKTYPSVKNGSIFANVKPNLVFCFDFKPKQNTWYGVSAQSYCLQTGRGHFYGEWQVVTEATEDADGLSNRTCVLCNDTEEKILPKLSAETTESTATVTPDSGTATSTTNPAPTKESSFPLWTVFLGGGIVLAGGAAIGFILRKKKFPEAEE